MNFLQKNLLVNIDAPFVVECALPEKNVLAISRQHIFIIKKRGMIISYLSSQA